MGLICLCFWLFVAIKSLLIPLHTQKKDDVALLKMYAICGGLIGVIHYLPIVFS